MYLRPSRFHSVTGLLSLAMAAGGSLYAVAQAPGPQGPPSVLDGVYTAAQAESGAELFESTCIRCHTPEQFVAGGLYSPAARFRNVGEMFEAVSTRMPADDPGSLSAEQYTAAVSFLLRTAGYPAGQAALTPDADKLAPILVVPLPASASR